jgi:hypothetical protein
MEKQAILLLEKIVSLENVSLYDLIDMWARMKKTKSRAIFNETVQQIQLLAAHGLVQLPTDIGEDGSETFVNATELGKTYLKSVNLRQVVT